MRRRLLESFYRLAATGLVPRRWLAPDVPAGPPAPPGDRPLELEIVSHCWRYGRFLAYQLSSLVLHPPATVSVRMTVFYSPEDRDTAAVLDYFGALDVPGVEWNWQELEPTRLFRRAIGRNLAARATTADWLWLSDCDVLFRDGALDAAGSALRGRDDVLVFPREHRVSDILEHDDPLRRPAAGPQWIVDIDPAEFRSETRDKAVGGFQIVRGDVARAGGYCATIPFYQQPVPRWQKTYEDRTFRWLLGTHGTAVEIPGLYRIRHAEKGRDPGSESARDWPPPVLRRARAWLRRRRQGPVGRQR
jgi:hypothetical protein